MPRKSTCLSWLGRSALVLLCAGPVICVSHIEVGVKAQTRAADGRARNPGLPGWCETPAAERKEEGGCYTTAMLDLGVPARGPIYWHLDTFPTRAAAEASRTPASSVVDSHDRHWLFTIAGQGWRPAGGTRVAQIGPLTIDADTPYTARYLEAVIPAGFQQGIGAGHRHPGPEAWYVLAGAQCLETPNGVMTAHAGETMLAPDGWPMAISSLGPETRRTVFLVLHRRGESYSMPVDAQPDAPHAHWTPKGLCPK